MVTCKILSINLRISGGLVGEDWRPKQDVSSQLFSLSIWYILTNKITRWREIDFHSSLQHVFKYRNQLLREIDILNWYTILKLIYSSFKYINNTFIEKKQIFSVLRKYRTCIWWQAKGDQIWSEPKWWKWYRFEHERVYESMKSICFYLQRNLFWFCFLLSNF